MDFPAIIDLVKETPELAVLGMLWYFARGKVKEYDEHLKTCNEIPKAVLLDRLNDLCERIDRHIDEQSKMSKQVNILVGRQMERDSH